MNGAVVHFEISGKDGEQLKQFYAKIFGWNVDSSNPMNYGMVAAPTDGQGIGGGISGSHDGKTYATFYVAVTDLEGTLKKIEQSGGKVVVPVTDIPGVVTFAMITDPEGNLVGVLRDQPPRD